MGPLVGDDWFPDSVEKTRNVVGLFYDTEENAVTNVISDNEAYITRTISQYGFIESSVIVHIRLMRMPRCCVFITPISQRMRTMCMWTKQLRKTVLTIPFTINRIRIKLNIQRLLKRDNGKDQPKPLPMSLINKPQIGI